MKYDYRVCIAQQGKVTFVNGKWQGTTPPDETNALITCPEMHTFLTSSGDSGWELVTVVGRARARAGDASTLDRVLLATAEAAQGWHTWNTLYLKKSLP